MAVLGQKINDDSKLDDEDKFQYLLQAHVVGSKAWELVENFPPQVLSQVSLTAKISFRTGRVAHKNLCSTNVVYCIRMHGIGHFM